jgi:hypothetical protein
MGIHDFDPRTEIAYPTAKSSRWDEDYGTRGFVERDRPYIDDQPAHRHGWEANSPWGSRPVREVDREFDRGRTTGRFFNLNWTRMLKALGLTARDGAQIFSRPPAVAPTALQPVPGGAPAVPALPGRAVVPISGPGGRPAETYSQASPIPFKFESVWNGL